MKTLWVEKYRPSTVEGYVFRDDAQRSQVLRWINDKYRHGLNKSQFRICCLAETQA